MTEDPTKLYKIEKCIGSGNFGDVYKAQDLNNDKIVAIKTISLEETDEDVDVLIQEINFLRRLKSQYITRYIKTYVRNSSLWVIMEYCGGGSCADLLKYHGKLQENHVAYIIREALLGLQYLHSENKIHRDIKAANILLTADGKVKLGDFGVSGEITETVPKMQTFVGTPFWMAPEIVTRTNGYDEKADLWSLGITTIELLTGKPPHSREDPMRAVVLVPARPAPTLSGDEFSQACKDFVSCCLTKDPIKRFSASQLLRTKFIKSVKKHIDLVPIIKERDECSRFKDQVRKPRHLKYLLDIHQGEGVSWDFPTIVPATPCTTPNYDCNKLEEGRKRTRTHNIEHISSIAAPVINANKPTSTPKSLKPRLDLKSKISMMLMRQSPTKSRISPYIENKTPLTSAESFVSSQFSPINSQPEGSPETLISSASPDPDANMVKDCKMSKSFITLSTRNSSYQKNHKFKEYDMAAVLQRSLRNISKRSYSAATRQKIEVLANDIESYEEEIPGFSEVFLEEIWNLMYKISINYN